MNGARGAVESFDSEGYPVVRFIGGKKEAVKMEKWQGGLALRLVHTPQHIYLRLSVIIII